MSKLGMKGHSMRKADPSKSMVKKTGLIKSVGAKAPIKFGKR